MVKNTLSSASLAMLLAWGSSYAAEPAGRVLLLQGSALAVRGTQEVPLARGVTVETGDLLRVAEGSSLQVRFTDESVVALRANTQFKIEDYKFTENGAGDKSIFSLLKGGLRTITGLIGKRSPEAYQVLGSTATIGIRGTHFSVVNCAGDCTNVDGSQAKNGLYGGVTDGRIVVTNQAGESEFGRDQYFVVTSSNTLPKPLMAPPSFLHDRLDGLTKAPRGGQGKAAEAGASGSSSVLETTSPAFGVVADVVAGSLLTSPFSPANSPLAGSLVKSEATGSAAPVNPLIPLPNGAGGIAAASVTTGGTYAAGLLGGTLTFGGGALTQSIDCCSPPNNYTSGVSSDFGADGIIAWGRWNSGFGQGGQPLSTMNYVAVLSANAVTASSIIRGYAAFASTAPTVTSGGVIVATGTPNTVTGSFTVNFANLVAGGSLSYALSIPVAGQTFSIAGNAAQYAGTSFLGTSSTITSTGAGCTPSCTGNIPFGDAIQGVFTGASAQRAGANYGFNSPLGKVSGAVVLK